MPLDNDLRRLLAMLEQAGTPQLAQGTPEQARAAFRRLTVGFRSPESLPAVASVEELAVEGAAGELPARLYRPLDAGDGPLPTVVMFHGGGWVIGDLDTHEDQARLICSVARTAVLSVGYRLAPEAPFPAPFDDCLAATRWAADHVERLGGDPARLAVAGDSAGGNLAAAVAQACRDAGAPALAAQLLIYPATDAPGDYASRERNAEGYLLTRADMEWFVRHYVSDEEQLGDPRVSPLRGRLEGLPPAVVGVAEFDPLHDEGAAYAQALGEAGVPVVLREGPGLIHGFFAFGPVSPAAKALTEQLCRDLGERLGTVAAAA